ncbi:MAG: hypothetical protein LBR17_08495 [Bacteroidales bacterium]|jgi:hypothetical protein|nr:hypothetical protein [Bacteroidales bacterium]
MIQIFIRFWNFIRVRNAIIYAKAMNKQTGKRYYVLQLGGKIRVLDKQAIETLVRRNILQKRMREHYELIKYALFFTK